MMQESRDAIFLVLIDVLKKLLSEELHRVSWAPESYDLTKHSGYWLAGSLAFTHTVYEHPPTSPPILNYESDLNRLYS